MSGFITSIDGGSPGGSASGDLSGSFPSPTVNKVEGVDISGTPAANNFLQATSSSAASWVNPTVLTSATTLTITAPTSTTLDTASLIFKDGTTATALTLALDDAGATSFTYASGATASFVQTQRAGTGSNAGADFTIRAQQGQAVSSGTNNAGGTLRLAGGLIGTGGAGAQDGSVVLTSGTHDLLNCRWNNVNAILGCVQSVTEINGNATGNSIYFTTIGAGIVRSLSETAIVNLTPQVYYYTSGVALGGTLNITSGSLQWKDASDNVRLTLNGTGVGFNAATPIARPDYTVSNPSTSRTLDVGTATLAELRAVVGTLLSDFISYGLLQ